MKTINDIRASFHEAVSIVCSDPSVYAKSPHKDFSRNRKLPMESIVRFILSAHTESIPKELLKFLSMMYTHPLHQLLFSKDRN